MKNLKSYSVLWTITCVFICASCHKSNSASSSSPASPAISNVNPQYGPDSTIVTITGTGFSATAADDNVSFNGKQATLISASDTALVARVPTLAGTGDITVTVNGKTLNGPAFNYDTTYRLSTIIGGLNAPQYVSIDASGNLYVGLSGGSSVIKINPSGDSSIFAPVVGGDRATATDAAGNVYFAAAGNYDATIYKFTPAGVGTPIATDSGVILDLAVDKSGNVYAGNQYKNTIDKITPQGVVSVFVNLPMPSGVVVGNDGNIYATTTSDPSSLTAGAVVKITPGGVMTTVADGLMFGGADGITIDANGVLYVTCYNIATPATAVVKIEPIGSGTNKTILTTKMSLPLGITIDNTGNLYVVDNVIPAANYYGSVDKLTMH